MSEVLTGQPDRVRQNPDLPMAMVAAVRDIIGAVNFAPLHEPEFRGNEKRYVSECIDTGWVSSVGAFVDRFERDLADYCSAAYAVATANGTSALHAALVTAGVLPGEEVLVPTLTFIATANAVLYASAVPHFVDSEKHTGGIDPEALDAYLAGIVEQRSGRNVNRLTGRPIAALLPVHIFGHACRIEQLAAVAEKWNLLLIEDAAEALGTFYNGRHLGTAGKLGCLSFNGNKIVTTGGGGAILTNDPELAARAKHLTTTARVPHRWSFIHDETGFNYRMPNLNAALGCAQLERLPDMLARKRQLAELYIRHFRELDGAEIVMEPAGCESNYWLVAARLDRADLSQRDACLEALVGAGYGARPLWTPMHRLPMHADFPSAPLPVAEELEHRLICLPSSPGLVAT